MCVWWGALEGGEGILCGGMQFGGSKTAQIDGEPALFVLSREDLGSNRAALGDTLSLGRSIYWISFGPFNTKSVL